MHNNGNWHDGMGSVNWWWIPMMLMMVAFWGGLIWLGVTLIKRNHTAQPFAAGPTPTSTAAGILGERLARGEIEADEYRQRLAALQPPAT